MTSWHRHVLSALLAFCGGNPPVTGGFPAQRASNVEIWCFLSCEPGSSFEQIVEWLVKWDASMLIWLHPNVSCWRPFCSCKVCFDRITFLDVRLLQNFEPATVIATVICKILLWSLRDNLDERSRRLPLHSVNYEGKLLSKWASQWLRHCRWLVQKYLYLYWLKTVHVPSNL